MLEPYTVIEMMTLHSAQTTPQRSPFSEPLLLHAAVDGENGEATVVCPYLLVADKDLIKRGLEFFGNLGPIVHGVDKCPACAAKTGATT